MAVPVSDLSEEWSDDERMSVMFAPLRTRELNPESWSAKVTFWTDLIERWCRANGRCVVTLDEMKTVMQRKGRTPHCLAEVSCRTVNAETLVSNVRTDAGDDRGGQGWTARGEGPLPPVALGQGVLGRLDQGTRRAGCAVAGRQVDMRNKDLIITKMSERIFE